MRAAYFRLAGVHGIALAVGVLGIGGAPAAPAIPTPTALPTVEIAFRAAASEGVEATATGPAGFLAAVHRSGGDVGTGAGAAWTVAANAPAGEGTLDFLLDRSRISGDLALVLRADWKKTSDAAIQLYDAGGLPLALDLFGNVAENARAAATDTFVVPLTRYPQATRLSVRRLSGPMVIHAAGLFPVLSELPASAEAQAAIARQLGLVSVQAGEGVGATTGAQDATDADEKAAGVAFGAVHTAPPLERINQIGAVALARAGYPVFHRMTSGPLKSVGMANSGTTCYLVEAAMHRLAAESGSALKQPDFTSSDGVAEELLSGQITVGFMSVPLTSAEKEQFFAARGYPIMEFRLARDAIEVLVNPANPLTEISVPQLDAIYAESPRAGASKSIREWSALGGSGQTIKVLGGAPDWGTTKTFQQLVLKGGLFRAGIKVEDVVYRRGIEKAVASDPAAIGYVSLRPREKDVRVLAVAANSGEKAWPVDADSIYSGHYPLQRTFYGYVARRSFGEAEPLERELVNLLLSDEGQFIVTRSGSLPLSAQEVREARIDTGLPGR